MEWQSLRNSQVAQQFTGLEWTNVISKGIRSVHPYCSIAFKRRKVKVQGSSMKGPIFTTNGYCRFKDCEVKFKVEVSDESTLKACVFFTGGEVCHHHKELKTRPLRADARSSFGVTLESKLPKTVYLESLQKLPETVMESGCRDEAPNPKVLKNLSCSERKLKRCHENELLSLHKMLTSKTGHDNEVMQKVIMHPKGVMLWSKKTMSVFHKRCKTDIVYLDATGSIVQKDSASSPPVYVYELVVRNPEKGASPLPVATYVTCDHTTSSVLYFLQAFMTDHSKMYGKKSSKRPVMMVCDGSPVLLRAISWTFCQLNLEDLIQQYYEIITGQSTRERVDIPILHRCLSHIMKNAKDLCKKK